MRLTDLPQRIPRSCGLEVLDVSTSPRWSIWCPQGLAKRREVKESELFARGRRVSSAYRKDRLGRQLLPSPRIDRVFGAREVGENERSTAAVFAGCSKRSGEVQEGSSRRVSHQHRGSSSAQAVCSPPESLETLSEIASNIFLRQI